MPDVEIKRRYEVLPDNNVRFGIRIINVSDSVISEVEVILDYNVSLFELEGGKLQNLGTIPPAGQRTAKFILKPRGCIHKEEIAATVRCKDAQWNRHSVEMRPKEVHCVCPFLKEKPINRADFLALAASGYVEERGINFEGIAVDKLLSFLLQTCQNRLYRVDDVPVEHGRILYLAADAVGEKAYYLLTAVVVEQEGFIQVLLRASSDKRHGLIGFLNELMENLRHLVSSVARAREIGIIKQEQVINIIDSVVQRTSIAAGGEGAASVTIKDSVVQHTEIKADEQAKRRRCEEEERERLRREGERKEQEKKAREEAEKRKREQEQQKTFTNSIGMKFTLIPSGEFEMGAKEIKAEQPVHKVTIKNPFYLGTYPVTQREWKAVMGHNPSRFKSLFKGDNRPVENVSWYDVQEFIKKLNEQEGTDKYRLPSEAEWEYACRAGTTTRYSFGDSDSKLGDYAWYADNSGDKTHPVGEKKPNPWGLYDMHGNVFEWVQDHRHRHYNGAPADGSAWEGSGADRVLRGGSWSRSARDCRTASRDYDAQGVRGINLGFRLARSV
jgi:formylglycine-generating enzyme required for sulfatase activity